ncbi:uncharacterized protein TNCV_116591 [Trichonephila clavipes]|nr:uncharacterized protein TNCV_116591 [Trichonephila clavipes]
MLPGEFDIPHSVVSRLWKSFKTTGMYSRRHGGGRVRNTTPADDRYIVLYQQKGTGAPQLSRWQISFLLPQESRSPEKLLPIYTHADLLCVSHCPDSTVLLICNGVVSITIGLNRTGHAYYSQMRVGSVCHRMVDAN